MTKLGVVKSSALKSRAAPKDTTASVQDYLAAIYDLQSSRTRWGPSPLAQAREGATVVVERITEEAEADKKLLEHLWKNDVRPGRRLKITEVAPWAGTITAASDGQTITLGLPAAAKIWVYLPKP